MWAPVVVTLWVLCLVVQLGSCSGWWAWATDPLPGAGELVAIGRRLPVEVAPDANGGIGLAEDVMRSANNGNQNALSVACDGCVPSAAHSSLGPAKQGARKRRLARSAHSDGPSARYVPRRTVWAALGAVRRWRRLNDLVSAVAGDGATVNSLISSGPFASLATRAALVPKRAPNANATQASVELSSQTTTTTSAPSHLTAAAAAAVATTTTTASNTKQAPRRASRTRVRSQQIDDGPSLEFASLLSSRASANKVASPEAEAAAAASRAAIAANGPKLVRVWHGLSRWRNVSVVAVASASNAPDSSEQPAAKATIIHIRSPRSAPDNEERATDESNRSFQYNQNDALALFGPLAHLNKKQEQLIDLLAQFYAHLQQLHDQLKHTYHVIWTGEWISSASELEIRQNELGQVVIGCDIAFKRLVDGKKVNQNQHNQQWPTNDIEQVSKVIKQLQDELRYNNKVDDENNVDKLHTTSKIKLNQIKQDKTVKSTATSSRINIRLNDTISDLNNNRNSNINNSNDVYVARSAVRLKYYLIMKQLGADEASLLNLLREKQDKFGSLKNVSFELINERPRHLINVCEDGPKILIMPNVNDIFYCYTSEQWIAKLWTDLKLSTFHYPIIILNILIFLFGTTGNIFVCLSVKRNHQLRSVTNYFIVNLAFADFLVILICLPATVVWDLSLTWFFDTLPCKLIMFLQDVSISVSVLTLTAISIDRYYAICHPLKFKSNLRQAKRVIALIWLVSLVTMAPDLIYLSAKPSSDLVEAGLSTVLYSDCNYDWSESASKWFTFVKTILLYFLPFLLMFCAHYRILKVLHLASSLAQHQEYQHLHHSESQDSQGLVEPLAGKAPVNAMSTTTTLVASCNNNNADINSDCGHFKYSTTKNMANSNNNNNRKRGPLRNHQLASTTNKYATSQQADSISQSRHQAAEFGATSEPKELDDGVSTRQIAAESQPASSSLIIEPANVCSRQQETLDQNHASSEAMAHQKRQVRFNDLSSGVGRRGSETDEVEPVPMANGATLNATKPFRLIILLKQLSSGSGSLRKLFNTGQLTRWKRRDRQQNNGNHIDNNAISMEHGDAIASRYQFNNDMNNDDRDVDEEANTITATLSIELEPLDTVLDQTHVKGVEETAKSNTKRGNTNDNNNELIKMYEFHGHNSCQQTIASINGGNNNNNSNSKHIDSCGQARSIARTMPNASNTDEAMILTMHNKSKLDSRRKAAKMLTAIVVLFGICYLPVHLINFLRQFIDDIPQTDVTSTICMLAHCICYLNSAINPIIYNHMNSVFRAEFKKFLSCLDCLWSNGKSAPNGNQLQRQASSFKLHQTTANIANKYNNQAAANDHQALDMFKLTNCRHLSTPTTTTTVIILTNDTVVDDSLPASVQQKQDQQHPRLQQLQASQQENVA